MAGQEGEREEFLVHGRGRPFGSPVDISIGWRVEGECWARRGPAVGRGVDMSVQLASRDRDDGAYSKERVELRTVPK